MPWDPVRDMMALQDRLGRIQGREPGWNPPVDVYETPDRYVVAAELPGLTREHIQIEVRDTELTIRGQRPDPGVAPDAYHRMERLQGPFARTFVFSESIAGDQITAEFRDGVLTVTVPKASRPEPRVIAVK
ncbi:MAG TPA: Hsp20/alpha crystallin family protein [Vicinamibacterales bacterium]|nr:Hsp20/alpha crystallin family protein [Vicinamibacterales bacterium]